MDRRSVGRTRLDHKHSAPSSERPSGSLTPPRKVSRSNRIPLYYQVETDIRSRIERGDWKPGQQIPTEAQLCDLYGASRITIRQAVSNLANEGLLVREAGRGTFVSEPWVTAGTRGLTSFTEEMRGLGLQAGARVLDLRIEIPSPETVQRLQLEPDSPIVVVKRLRLGNSKPIGIQTAFLPAARYPGLEQAPLADTSLYGYLQEHYGVIPTEAEETFWVAPVTGEDARLLNVRSGTCGFLVERLTFDSEGPFEFVTSVMRGDRYRIHLGLRAMK